MKTLSLTCEIEVLMVWIRRLTERVNRILKMAFSNRVKIKVAHSVTPLKQTPAALKILFGSRQLNSKPSGSIQWYISIMFCDHAFCLIIKLKAILNGAQAKTYVKKDSNKLLFTKILIHTAWCPIT